MILIDDMTEKLSNFEMWLYKSSGGTAENQYTAETAAKIRQTADIALLVTSKYQGGACGAVSFNMYSILNVLIYIISL